MVSYLTQVDLYVSCRNLADLDILSKSDPICFLSEYNEMTKSWIKLGQTEQIANNLNPDFMTRFTLNYFYEQIQMLKFTVVDADGAGDHDLIGEV